MKNGLPKSNNGPCMCHPQKGDSLEGIPDHVQRPARKEVNVKAIGPNMKVSNGGYKVVEVRSGGEPVGMGREKRQMRRKVEIEYGMED